MISTPIPDHEIWPGSKRIVLGPPDHDPTGPIRPAEAIAWTRASGDQLDGALCYSFRLQLEEGDLLRLAIGTPLWLTFIGSAPPFSTTIGPPTNPRGTT